MGMPKCRLRLLVVLFTSTVLLRQTTASVLGSLVSSVTSCDEREPVSIFDDPTAPALASDVLAMQYSTRTLGRIDTHHHLVPSFYSDYLDKYGECCKSLSSSCRPGCMWQRSKPV